MTTELRKDALIRMNVKNGKARLSPESYIQFFEGLKEQLLCILERDFERQCAEIEDTDTLLQMAKHREIALIMINELIFVEMEEKAQQISESVTGETDKPHFAAIPSDEVSALVNSMLVSAKEGFVQCELATFERMEAEEKDDITSAKLSHQFAKQILQLLLDISFKSEPEANHELTNPTPCLH